LDLLNLSKSNSGVLGAEIDAALEETATRGLAFLHRITYPDDSFPLFNDSVQNAAPSVKELYIYASKFFDLQLPYYPEGVVLIDEPDSGLYGYRQGKDMLLIDCGDIGPNYQPGHSHCDFLSFELLLDGRPVIVDSGVYEYQAGEMRDYVRSTAAHNTLSVDGQEQSEIWGEFRMARRAKRQKASIRPRKDGGVKFCGSYSGFPQVAGEIVHQRTIRSVLKDDRHMLMIQDQVQGEGVHIIDSYLHFHPEVELEDKGQGLWRLLRDKRHFAYLVINGVSDEVFSVRLEDSWYCPEFGIRQKNRVLVISTRTVLPADLSYRIERTA
jgi:uncharacterized heparinase superfamily protein